MPARPVFHKELGEFFKNLREGKGWTSQRQTATIARNRKIAGINYQVLQRLESGRLKNPEPELLRALADLYEQPYDRLVSTWVACRFGTGKSDLVRHDEAPMIDPSRRVDDAVETGVELQELKDRVARYEKEAREVRTVFDSLRRVAFALEEIRKAPKGKTNRRGADRKTG